MRNLPRHRSKIHRRLAAWVGILALTVQTLLASLALASPSTGVVICTAQGLKWVALSATGEEQPPPTEEPLCPICLAAHNVQVAPPTSAALPIRTVLADSVSWPHPDQTVLPRNAAAPLSARAPPRV
ncbi:MAG: DUF2946 family protein [Pseudomonadota bacterium]